MNLERIEEKTFLYCSFDDKNQCKKMGGKWDGKERKWYAPPGAIKAKFEKWLSPQLDCDDPSANGVGDQNESDDGETYERILVDCPFKDKQACKDAGGKWDKDAKKW